MAKKIKPKAKKKNRGKKMLRAANMPASMGAALPQVWKSIRKNASCG